MSTRIFLILGIGLIVLGLGQIFQISMVTETLTLPSCLGGSRTITLGAAPFSLFHCWGCYAALAGLAVSAAGIVRARRQRAM